MNCAIELRMMKSLTTETEIWNPSQPALEASEYSQRSFTVEIPIEKLMTDQLVSLRGVIRLPSRNIPFEATGKIISALSLGNGSVKADIYLHQFDKNLWDQFLRAKDQAQNHADQLFKKMKGEI